MASVPTPQSQPLGIIRVGRGTQFAGSGVPVTVSIDGQKRGSLWLGQEKDFPVAAGPHLLEVRLWGVENASQQVHVGSGEVAAMKCVFEMGLLTGKLRLEPADASQPVLAQAVTDGPPAIVGGLPPVPTQVPAGEADVEVSLSEACERVRVATEEIQVPPGVTIRVTRSRTVEYTVELSDTTETRGGLEAGVQGVLGGSIRRQIARQQGRSEAQSETISYEIELSGAQATKYQLAWTDVWRQGSAAIAAGANPATPQAVPFRFRERAELEVLPIA